MYPSIHPSNKRQRGHAGAGEMILLTVPHKEPSRPPPAPPTPSAAAAAAAACAHPLAQFLDETRGTARRPRLQRESLSQQSGRAYDSYKSPNSNPASHGPRPATATATAPPPAAAAHPHAMAEEALPASLPQMLLIGTHADRAGVAGTHAASRSGSRWCVYMYMYIHVYMYMYIYIYMSLEVSPGLPRSP